MLFPWLFNAGKVGEGMFHFPSAAEEFLTAWKSCPKAYVLESKCVWERCSVMCLVKRKNALCTFATLVLKIDSRVGP